MAHVVLISTKTTSRKLPYEGSIFADDEITSPTNEIRQSGPTTNGIAYYKGSFPTAEAAEAAVRDYFSGYRLALKDSEFTAWPK